MMPTIYLCNIIQFYFMTSAKTYLWVLPHVFHAISRDVIIKFHTLFHTCCGNSYAFSHMLRKSTDHRDVITKIAQQAFVIPLAMMLQRVYDVKKQKEEFTIQSKK
jgi:hypothetical protein